MMQEKHSILNLPFEAQGIFKDLQTAGAAYVP